ncbi:hypothetical protein Nepgr_018069 [Nepenthes gracilis]|uniref:Uncharacterized protein n=1 Tax=Nepenthes gracilis TaxID=150966 RepID=A0AAD3XT48_NEPGR|nr:hypothetical protein Nepgr_018069 [Nepenthes gracilis]
MHVRWRPCKISTSSEKFLEVVLCIESCQGMLAGNAENQKKVDAARSTLAHETDKIDKARVAGGSVDLLDVAKSYENLEDKSFGKYVDKAKDYLNQHLHKLLISVLGKG